METVITELGTALICLLAGGCVIAWIQELLTYVSILL